MSQKMVSRFIHSLDNLTYDCIRWVLHHRKVYRSVHKRHHELTAPIAIGTIYCTPIEHIVNLFTLAIVLQFNSKNLTILRDSL